MATDSLTCVSFLFYGIKLLLRFHFYPDLLPSSINDKINATVVVYPESSQIVQAHFVQNPTTIELLLHVRKRKKIFLDLMTYFIFLYYFKGKKSLQLLPGGKISYATEKTRETVSKGFTLCWIRRKSKEKIRV